MLTKNLTVRNYDVQAFTGYSTSTVAKGQWVRGQIVRFDQPTFRPAMGNLVMYDPTNPNTWAMTTGRKR